MTLKKLSRVVISAFVVAVLLTVSAMAYTLSIDGNIVGLESGIDYTAAQYDFVNNKYGEFTAISSESVLTTGVWGIKAGDSEPEALFVQGKSSGQFNFWNAEEEKVNSAVFKVGVRSDTYVPGFWSVKNTGAMSLVTFYEGYPL